MSFNILDLQSTVFLDPCFYGTILISFFLSLVAFIRDPDDDLFYCSSIIQESHQPGHSHPSNGVILHSPQRFEHAVIESHETQIDYSPPKNNDASEPHNNTTSEDVPGQEIWECFKKYCLIEK